MEGRAGRVPSGRWAQVGPRGREPCKDGTERGRVRSRWQSTRIVNIRVSDLLSSLGSPAATTGEREARLFALNAYLFEHELDAQVCFTDRRDGTFGIAAFMGPCGLEGVRRLNTQLMHSCDVVAFASPVEHNPRRIEVHKNRWAPTGLYEDRGALACEVKAAFTMRLP